MPSVIVIQPVQYCLALKQVEASVFRRHLRRSTV
jgi:hypothetical protein